MFRPRVIPVLLLKGKGLVKTINFKNPTYIGDPLNAVKIFNEHEADELVFLDTTASQENRSIDPDFVRRIGNEAFMPFAVGGGIKDVSHVRKLIGAGAEKVVLNTEAVRRPQLIWEAVQECGSQSVTVSIDVKTNFFGKPHVCINAGTEVTKLHPVDHAINMVRLGAGEIVINSIDLDGTMRGYDCDLVKSVAENVTVPVIACGGAGKLEDFRAAVEQGHAHAVAAGSMFVFQGPRRAVLINYPDKSELNRIFR